MADKSYSIDDILSEYPKVGDDGEAKGEHVNIDELLLDFDKGSSSDTAENAAGSTDNTDGSDYAAEPELSGNADKESLEKGSFEKKYEKLNGQMTAIKERAESEQADYTPPPKQERSFSEKMEQGDIYGDWEEEEKHGLFRKRHEASAEKLKRAGLTSYNDEGKFEEPEPKKPAESSPFDKYGEIADTEADTEETEYTAADEKSLDDILAEYAKEPKTKPRKNEYTQHRGITEFFTRIIPTEKDGSEGNTELLDGMNKLKRERLSRTQHISPIERKSISDIDLNLDDKILPDTAQIPIDKENSEAEKLNALKERRSRKIKDFVLVGDEDESESEEDAKEETEQRVIEDFETFDDAPSIAADINQLKNTLKIRFFVLILCLAASLYIAIANDTGALPIMDLLNKRTQTTTYLFVNAIIGLLAAFSSYTVVSCGLSKLISMKADCDSLCAVASVTSIAAAMVMFANTNLIKGGLVHIYVASAIFALLFNTAGKLLIVGRTQKNFRFISGSSEKYAVFTVADEDKAQNFTRGTLRDFPALASMRKTEFITEFLKTSYSSDSTDKFCRLFTPIVLGASVIVAVLAGITARSLYGASGLYLGISAFVGCVSVCSAFSVMLVVNLPMSRAVKKNSELQGALLGYDCIDEFADTNSILIDASELFPQGSVSLSAIKVFSDTRIDEAIVEAASLTNQSGSILKNMFYDIIAGKTELLNPVESYIFEDSMGLCGWINNKRVLLGNRELMTNHSIEGIPTPAKEREYTKNGKSAVYLSISGELSAMFIVEVTPSIEVKQALANLRKQGIYSIIRTVDSLVTINYLAELFDISPEFFKLIPFRLHPDFEEVTSYQPKQKATLACTGQFAALLSLILSCRSLRGTISAGIAIEAVSMLLGILICIALVILRSFSELTVTMTITYNLVFTAILLVFQLFRKN